MFHRFVKCFVILLSCIPMLCPCHRDKDKNHFQTRDEEFFSDIRNICIYYPGERNRAEKNDTQN